MERFFGKKLRFQFPPTLCLVCGVDSTPMKIFLLTIIGGLVLSSIFIMLWAYSTKRLDFKEDKANFPIETERIKT